MTFEGWFISGVMALALSGTAVLAVLDILDWSKGKAETGPGFEVLREKPDMAEEIK